MIVFELTSQLSYMVPVLLSVLVGRAVASCVSSNIYETIGNDRNLPKWPDWMKQKSYSLVAGDLMRPLPPPYYLVRYQTLQSLEHLLRQFPDVKAFPIVDSPNSMIYFGVAARYELEALVELWSFCLHGVASISTVQSTSPVSRTIDSSTLSPTSRFAMYQSQQSIAGTLTAEQTSTLERKSSHEKEPIDLVGLGFLMLDALNFHVTRDTYSKRW